MPTTPKIKRALISVSNKTGLIEFVSTLHQLSIEILSTGGTAALLREASIPVQDVSDITGFPEMMDGRVKTLHPKIHGGILGKRDAHADDAAAHQIEWIDLVIVNLYPFAETKANEQIDIGGPALIRAAAKNRDWVTVIVDPEDYVPVIQELRNKNTVSAATRQALAAKAFALTADYDYLISQSFLKDELFPNTLSLHFQKSLTLRYGENPQQKAAAFHLNHTSQGILSATVLQGKPLSYNNLLDADAAVACVKEFLHPACVIVKHANPCGVATHPQLQDAFLAAFNADNLSAFGGIIALNRECDEALAQTLLSYFVEVIIAPAFTETALALLAAKSNLRVLQMDFAYSSGRMEYRFIEGGVLVQEKDTQVLHANDLKTVTKVHPKEEELKTLLFGWSVVKHVKSNAIVIAKTATTVGIGAGQMSRVDAVQLAIHKAQGKTQGTALASDAFFPFRDNIDKIAAAGIQTIIQPGGSVRDKEVIEACDEHGIAMVFTGVRCFKH